MLSDELKAKIRDSFIALKEDMDGFQVRRSQNKMIAK
jgi:ATP-dependent DNA helicase DinG